MPSLAKASARISLADLVGAGLLTPGDRIYNIAHNRRTKTQDRLYVVVRLGEDDKPCLEVAEGQILDMGTRFKTLSEFMRAHLNEKIVRGETDRLTVTASVWDWTFTAEGRRFRDFRAIIRGDPVPIPRTKLTRLAAGLPAKASADDRATFEAAIALCFELYDKYAVS